MFSALIPLPLPGFMFPAMFLLGFISTMLPFPIRIHSFFLRFFDILFSAAASFLYLRRPLCYDELIKTSQFWNKQKTKNTVSIGKG
jgi:hypothetical protein